MKKNNLFLFSSWFMGVLFIIFALAMAFATFIENDYGPTISRKWIYGTSWFELILFLLVVNLIGQVFIKNLFSRKKLPILLFHLSFILIIIGAGITRYFGFDGSIHIREGQSQNICQSAEDYLTITLKDKTDKQLYRYEKEYVITESFVDRFEKSFTAENKNYSVKLVGFIPNAVETIIESKNGTPMVGLMTSNKMMGRQLHIIKQGDIKDINESTIGFTDDESVPNRISFEKDSFYIQSNERLVIMNMTSQRKTEVDKGRKVLLKPMVIYNLNGNDFVVQKLTANGEIRPVSHGQQSMMSRNVLVFEVKSDNKVQNLNFWFNNELNPTNTNVKIEDNTLDIAFGPKKVILPFELKLDKFLIERYPGSNSPSSYRSEVTLVDKDNHIEKPYSIYMNHILKYRGYRFYQSSYDKNEMGTTLSVNHDRWGMMVTYLGYILLFLFIILSIFNKSSLLKTITINAWNSIPKKTITIVALILLSSTLSFSNNPLTIDKSVADNFGKILVQDQKGRTKPLYTLSNDIIRKVTKKNQFENYSSMQVFLGFYFDFDSWKDVKLIKVTNSDIAKKIGITEDYAAFSDIVDLKNNSYKLSQFVEEAYSKPEASKNKFDKEIIKLDERINVIYMIYTGEFLKIFPLKNKTTNWGSPKEALKYADSKEDSLYLNNIMNLVFESAQKASISKNYKEVDEFLNSIKDYQAKFAGYPLPSRTKVNIEVTYTKAKIFEKLFPFYATLGLVLIIALIFGIVSGKGQTLPIIKYLNILLIIGFAVHTLGLALRWYISGHAPMSNGYESMLFISWATLLAGFVFSKNSPFALAATAVLSALTLLVAHLSFMDPEITNLVPVLKSYWLTLHVSIITGSYGFLGLGAVLGLIVMVLCSFVNTKNRDRIFGTIDELTIINYKTLTLGLYFLTIGTFLGAVWANESWGRYWGWDPKETWSLITMIIYSFVIHSRMIKSLRSIFIFNVLSLFAFSSVLMTYFGVNYYLSGLHSYASGDPIPVPTFVYITVIALVSLTILASIRYKRFEVDSSK